jgi:hypothetical protein
MRQLKKSMTKRIENEQAYMLDTGFFSKKFTKKPVASLEEQLNQVLSTESYETELEAGFMPDEPSTDKNVQQ